MSTTTSPGCRDQYGVFAHRQALEVDATPRMIATRVANGRWLELDHHVYSLPSHPPTWLRQLKAAQLRFSDAAISGRAAVALHGLANLGPGAIDVNVGRTGGRGRSRLARVHRRDDIPTVTVEGIRVVTAEWAIADLAANSTAALVERAVDDALVRQLREELGTEHESVQLVANHLGYGVESVRKWLREQDVGIPAGR